MLLNNGNSEVCTILALSLLIVIAKVYLYISKHDRTLQTLCLSGQPILKINKLNQAIYTIQQPIKIHLISP